MDERERVERLAADYESALADDRDARRARGAFYTPPELVGWILDRALPPPAAGPASPSGTLRVLDPACGTGHFLVAAARRLGDVRAVHGSDLDAEAVAIARRRLRVLDPTLTDTELADHVRVADGLAAWEGERFDAVVGNPPFLGQLRRRTASGGPRTHDLGPYADTSAVFLRRALDLVVPGGVVALVQPLSVLATRDAAPVREAVAARGRLIDLWTSAGGEFAGATVRTCVPVVRVGDPDPAGDPEWGRLAAPRFGIPAVDLPTDAGTIGDLATCTADFRDQYYGLVPFVRDGDAGAPDAPGAPLVTSGLIEPAACEWGSRATRFARASYDAPVVDVAALRAAGGPLAAWLDARLVPKCLVAGQGRVIEAVVDADGTWVPSVPVVSVVPREADDLWRVLAVLMAPPVVAAAAARYLGAGLAPGSVKLSARQVAALPLPPDAARWDEGAELARRAQQGPDERDVVLAALADVMTAAYGRPDGDLARWWVGRALARPGR